MKLDTGIVHFLRSTFCDWEGETKGCPREVIEAVLVQDIKEEAKVGNGDLISSKSDGN